MTWSGVIQRRRRGGGLVGECRCWKTPTDRAERADDLVAEAADRRRVAVFFWRADKKRENRNAFLVPFAYRVQDYNGDFVLARENDQGAT
jgi:hypothetical protein